MLCKGVLNPIIHIIYQVPVYRITMSVRMYVLVTWCRCLLAGNFKLSTYAQLPVPNQLCVALRPLDVNLQPASQPVRQSAGRPACCLQPTAVVPVPNQVCCSTASWIPTYSSTPAYVRTIQQLLLLRLCTCDARAGWLKHTAPNFFRDQSVSTPFWGDGPWILAHTWYVLWVPADPLAVAVAVDVFFLPTDI